MPLLLKLNGSPPHNFFPFLSLAGVATQDKSLQWEECHHLNLIQNMTV
jgi:hypothetical protein